ncbi:hypothetical protein HTS88_21025 [Pseudarthrobacter oxydans]|uniref:hypothetical protein n=1 Tax=Pseudarthrobacter oxydans TaxID=1671 RepID=UPI0015735A29|nr:hypothetical protein [Pseudarthrobacter oxydans]NSX38865.1 hypothetical protein [Pseudarthrobacter oxydans]
MTMSIDEILTSTGEDRKELNSIVRQYREMSATSEMVLADHWGVEDLVCSIEDLATRLQTIRELASQVPDDGSARSQLALAIEEIALPTHPAASDVLRDHLGLSDPTPEGNKLLLSDKPIYGWPHLRFATHAELSMSHRAMIFSSYIVNPATGAVGSVDGDETADETIRRHGDAFFAG